MPENKDYITYIRSAQDKLSPMPNNAKDRKTFTAVSGHCNPWAPHLKCPDAASDSDYNIMNTV